MSASILWRLALLVGRSLYLFAPLLVSAALAGVVLRRDWLRRLTRPVDGGRHWRGRRIFGDGKTWRGAVLSVAGCCGVVPLQQALEDYVPRALQAVDYSSVHVLGFGISLGLGAVAGELPNSFVKRQLGIPSGGTTRGSLGVLFFIWDQVDTLFGAWPLLCLWFRPSPSLVATSFLISVGLHPLLSWIGYRIGARRTAR